MFPNLCLREVWRTGLIVSWLIAQEATWLDSRKRLPAFEAERKKPGWVWTAYPAGGYDPNRGLGAALQANLSYNGPKQDSLFRYLPYRHFVSMQVGFYQRGVWTARAGYEWLWPKGRPYRIVIRTEARRDGQVQLWGVDAGTLSYDLNRQASTGRLSGYYQTLKEPFIDSTGILRTREAFHRVRMERIQIWFIGERLLAHGLLRVSAGVRYLYEKPTSLFNTPYRLNSHQIAYQAPTLYDSLTGRLPPYSISSPGHRFFLGGALIRDTRDFEIDPHKGHLVEIAQEVAIGRPLYKSSINLRFYWPLYQGRRSLPRLTMALRVLLYGTYGRQIPVWELYYTVSWAEARRLEALSGPLLLRGYLENRFIAPFGQVYQAELRLMFVEKNLFKQNFIGGILTFVDLGTGANSPTQWTYPWKGNLGLGTRVLWNLQTILRADAAYSKEGWQLIFTTRHTF